MNNNSENQLLPPDKLKSSKVLKKLGTIDEADEESIAASNLTSFKKTLLKILINLLKKILKIKHQKIQMIIKTDLK